MVESEGSLCGLELLFEAEGGTVSAFLLAAVVGAQRQPSVALAADLLVAAVLPSEGSQGRLETDSLGATSSKSQDQMERRL